MKLLGVCVFFLIYSATHEKKLPSFVQKCRKNDPSLGKCIAEQVVKFLPHLVDGVPGIKLPKIEPLRVTKLESKAPGFKMTFSDINVYGLKNMQVRDVQLDLDEATLDAHVFLPRLEITQRYELVGRLASFQLASGGKSETNSSNIDQRFHITGSKVEKNHQHYIMFDKVTSNITLPEVVTYLHDVFKDNPALTEETNKLINSENGGVRPYVNEIVENAMNTIFVNAVKEIFQSFSIEELFD